MSLERAREDQRLMDRDRRVTSLDFDVVIIGSGAGGGTMARALAGAGAKVLLVERGTSIPQEAENWSADAVWRQLRYRTSERWLDAAGSAFRPYTHYCVGGNTKFWGSVLYRLRREDFQAVEHLDGLSPAWPIDYDTLAPYYDKAERLYEVHGADGADPTAPPRAARSRSRRFLTRPRWRPSSPRSSARDCIRRRCRLDSAGPASRAAASSATPAIRFRAGFTPRATRKCAASKPRRSLRTSSCGRRPKRLALVTNPAGTAGRRGRPSPARRGRPRRRRASSSSRAAPSTPLRCSSIRDATNIPTGSRTPRASSAVATWRIWRR